MKNIFEKHRIMFTVLLILFVVGVSLIMGSPAIAGAGSGLFLMALLNRNTNFDRELVFENNIAVTADGYSTNCIDMGADVGASVQPINIIVDVTAKSGTNPTMDITICSETADSTPEDIIGTMNQITAVGRYHFTLPQDAKRYVRLHYDIGGTDTPSFTIRAWMTSPLV